MSVVIRTYLHGYHSILYNKRKTSYEVGRGKPMSNQQLVNLRI
ncbi:ATPase, partial [Bacillus toyonensis]